MAILVWRGKHSIANLKSAAAARRLVRIGFTTLKVQAAPLYPEPSAPTSNLLGAKGGLQDR
jgi:hypothetical protein